MNFGDWLDDEPVKPAPAGALVRVMRINADVSGLSATVDPWAVRLMNDDKVYLHGVLNALQLDKPYAYAYLQAYRERWERAARYCNMWETVINRYGFALYLGFSGTYRDLAG